MAGHSKWANIKHKKAAADAKRGKVFTQLSKEISVAARSSADPANNPRLRQLIEKAKAINMPSDTVARAIKRGTGELPGMHYEAQLYEGYGPHGIAVIIEALTDNKNRTVAELRRLFTSHGGSLAEAGAVGWMFNKLGVIRAKNTNSINEDTLLEHLIDFDIKDIDMHDNSIVIMCEPKSLEDAKKVVHDLELIIESADLEWIAQTPFNLEGSQADTAIDFLEKLEEHDDVQDVYTNLA